MKIRFDYVTNSSSSSFIISNNSNEVMTSEDVARKLFEEIIRDSRNRFELKPGESIEYECGDSYSDGAFECLFIIRSVDGEVHPSLRTTMLKQNFANLIIKGGRR